MTTNAQVVQLFTDVLTRWNEREAEFRDWQAGTSEGGPNADGRYPLTNGSGETFLVACPAKLADTVSGPAVLSEAAKVAAEAAQSASVSASTQSNNSRLLAENHKNAALAARDLALLYRDQCAAAQAAILTVQTTFNAALVTIEENLEIAEGLTNEALVARDAAYVARDAAAASAVLAATFDPSSYYNKTASDERYLQTVNFTWAGLSGKPTTFTPSAHSHIIGDVTGLQTALDGKQAAGSYAASVHTHVIADVTGLQTALDGKQATGSYVTTANFTWTNLSGKPSTFAPSAHSHVIADVTGLQTALDGKQASGSYVTTANFTWTNLPGKPTTFAPSAHSHVIADVTGLQTALDGKQAAGSYAPAVHAHDYLPLTGGTVSGGISMSDFIVSYNSATTWTDRLVAPWEQPAEILNTNTTGFSALTFHVVNKYANLFGYDENNVLKTNNSTIWHSGNFTPADKAWSVHGHAISDVSGLQTALDGKQASGSYVTTAGFTWAALSGKPTTFTPSAHTHVISEVTGLQTALDGKQASLGFTPYNATNPSGYISGITSANVTTALGYTPAGTNAPTFTSGVTVSNGGSQVQIGFDGNLEIIRNLGGAYIDFKDSGTEDFDVRVQAEGNKLNVTASGGFTVDGSLGIGTPSPIGKFQVSGAVGQGGLLIGYNGTSSNYYDADSHFFRTGAATARANIYARDFYASRGDGSGVIYLNEAGTRFLFFDGSKYNLVAAELNVNGVDILATLGARATLTGNNTMTGANLFRSYGSTQADANPGLQAWTNDNASGAWMSFHRSGLYAINMGLDSDNIFRIGGWSAPAGLMAMDMAGNVDFKGTYKSNGLGVPRWTTSGQTQANMTVSTAAPSGGSDGDIWYKVAS